MKKLLEWVIKNWFQIIFIVLFIILGFTLINVLQNINSNLKSIDYDLSPKKSLPGLPELR